MNQEREDFVLRCGQFEESLRMVLLEQRAKLMLPLLMPVPHQNKQAVLRTLIDLHKNQGRLTNADIDTLTMLVNRLVQEYENQRLQTHQDFKGLMGLERTVLEDFSYYLVHQGLSYLLLGGQSSDFELLHRDQEKP